MLHCILLCVLGQVPWGLWAFGSIFTAWDHRSLLLRASTRTTCAGTGHTLGTQTRWHFHFYPPPRAARRFWSGPRHEHGLRRLAKRRELSPTGTFSFMAKDTGHQWDSPQGCLPQRPHLALLFELDPRGSGRLNFLLRIVKGSLRKLRCDPQSVTGPIKPAVGPGGICKGTRCKVRAAGSRQPGFSANSSGAFLTSIRFSLLRGRL